MTPRFFIEHGVIHDRETGKHVRTSDSGGEDGIEECCTLLNSLDADRIAAHEALKATLFGDASETARASKDCPECGWPYNHDADCAALDAVKDTRITELETELSRWRKSFGGHVYVTNEKYAAMAAVIQAARELLASVRWPQGGAPRTESQALEGRLAALDVAAADLCSGCHETVCVCATGYHEVGPRW